jgi:hypothetical protein
MRQGFWEKESKGLLNLPGKMRTYDLLFKKKKYSPSPGSGEWAFKGKPGVWASGCKC